MAFRRISKEDISAIDRSIARNTKAEEEYGTRLDHDAIQDLIDDYYMHTLGVEDIDLYRKKAILVGIKGTIDYKKIGKEKPQLNPKLFADANKAEYLQIRSIIVSQIIVETIDDYRQLINTLLSFGFNDAWPDWITFTQESIFYKLRKDTKFNVAQYKKEYEKLMNNDKVPKLFLEKHLIPAYAKFKV